jgi:type VI secretion system protein ImpG
MPIGAALDLRSILTRSTQTIVARAANGGKTEVTLAAAGEIVAGNQATSDHGSADPHFAMRAYFAWPEQFAFVDIPNLARLASLGTKVRDYEIVLRLGAPLPPSLHLDIASLRLHCVPVVNVRRAPVVTAPLVGRRCALRLDDADVYSVEKVTLVRDDLSTLAAFPYAQLVPPAVGADGHLPILYRILRGGSALGSELDVSLDFVDPEGRGIPSDASSVDAELLVTDGARAAQLGIGDVCIANSASPPLVSFRNITPVTPSAAPATNDDRLWRWLQLLKANLPQLTDRRSLAEAMALANVAAWARWPGCKANPDDFEALLSVRTSRRTRADRAEVFPGIRVDIDVNEAHFSGRGDIDLFGECLAAFLASTLRSHEWAELGVHDAAGTPICEYPCRWGTRVIL